MLVEPPLDGSKTHVPVSHTPFLLIEEAVCGLTDGIIGMDDWISSGGTKQVLRFPKRIVGSDHHQNIPAL